MKKIAFLILAHDDPAHLKKLIIALDYNSDFYIHIDEKVEIEKFKSIISSKNVFFVKNRIPISWAGISMVDAQMVLINEVLKNKTKYSHAQFITGSCYPIKNIKTIYDEFISNPKKEYINFIEVKQDSGHYRKLIEQMWFKEPLFNVKNTILIKLDKGLRFLLNKLKLKNNWNKKVIPYMGHTWCALTMECCEYIHEFHLNNTWFRKMNRFTMASDEHYIHTIIGNSHFKQASFKNTKHNGRGLYQYTSIYLIDKSLTKWYDLNDWSEIVKSDKLFVRKINSKTGNQLVDKINVEILLQDFS